MGEKQGNIDSCDIQIIRIGAENFNEFAYLVGSLRFKYKLLEPGKTYRSQNYLVKVKNVHKDQNRIDSKNYLLLQNTGNHE